MKIFSLLLLSLCLIRSAHATTWYVATTGSDSNDCTQAQSVGTPKATINAGLACVGFGAGDGAGDTVSVASGTYTQTISTWPSGTAGNVFTLLSSTQYGAVIRPTGSSQILYFQANYITVDGFVVDGVNTDANNIWFQAVTGVTFQNGESKNIKVGGAAENSFQAFYMHDATGCTIKNNLIHDVANGAPHINSAGVYIASRSTIVEGNTVYNISGTGIHVYSESISGLDNNIIRNNRVYNYGTSGSATGILLYSGTNNLAYNNFVYMPSFSASAYGISIKGTGNKAFNNSLWNNAVGIDTTGAASAEIRNNILWQNGYDAGAGDIASHNLIGVNPDFVNTATGDLHLQATSDAIDAGTPIGSFSTDFDGNSRPQGTGWDIGADEYGAPPSSFSVDIPNGGETWQTGLVKTITWSSVIEDQNQSQTFNATSTWTAPSGVTSVTVDAWGGGGGGGGNATADDGGGGGGGGGFSRKVVTVTPTTEYTVTVGAAGTGGIGNASGGTGGDSWFSTSGTVLAKGGTGGANPISGAGGLAGAGGLSTSGIGDTRTGGGNGGAGRDSTAGTGGGGGGSGGLSGAGGAGGPGTASPGTAGTAGAGTPGGAAGGLGGNNTPAAGNAPGGGGGGGGDPGNGASGAAGRVSLTWVSGATVRIELSRNGGTNWEDIVASTADDGSYDWTVAGSTGANNVIRVSSLAGGSETDTSDAVFTIAASGGGGTITATSISGQRFKKGSQIPFGWTYSNVTGNVRIDLSRNDGTTWQTVIASTPVTSSAQSWIAETPVSSLCKFRVVSLNDLSVIGVSSGNFRIGGSLTLLGQ